MGGGGSKAKKTPQAKPGAAPAAKAPAAASSGGQGAAAAAAPSGAAAASAGSSGKMSGSKPGTEEAFNKRYELGKVLGKGNYSVVKLAKDRDLKIDVAIKCMTKAELTPEDKAALIIEVDVLYNLNHPAVIKLFAWYESPRMYWLSTELMPGGELFDRIVKKQFYKERDAQKVVFTLAGCLAYLHSQGIVHRDLKPENILLKSKEDDDDIKIADFGFVARVKPQGLSTTCGTPAYVAPEIISGKLYGTTVDMWSFGVIIYILLCGYPPFHHQNQAQLFRLVKKGEFKFDSPYWDPVSAGAKDLIKGLLELDTKKRLTAVQVLQHPWVASKEVPGEISPDLTRNLNELALFQAKRKLKAALKATIAAGKMTEIVQTSRIVKNVPYVDRGKE